MRKYLYFLASDARHLQTRLEKLADQGLELVSTEGLLCGRFEQMERRGLQYAVVSCGRAQEFPMEEIRHCGWELVGGFNGMAILKSRPCVDADREALNAALERSACLHPDRWTAPLMVLLSVVFAIFMFGGATWLGLGPWYASYRALGMAVFRWVAAALAAANLLTLRSYASAWVHGLTPWVILLGELFPVLLMSQLDESRNRTYFIGVLAVLALACGLTFWQKARALGLSLSGVCLLVLCLGLLFPNISRTEGSGKALRNEVSGRPVVTLSDLSEDSALTGSDYAVSGTFLARQTEYWEMSDSASVTSQVTCCLTRGVARQVLERTLNGGAWTRTDYGWQSREGKMILLEQGRTIAQISSGEALTAEQIGVIQNKLS